MALRHSRQQAVSSTRVVILVALLIGAAIVVANRLQDEPELSTAGESFDVGDETIIIDYGFDDRGLPRGPQLATLRP